MTELEVTIVIGTGCYKPLATLTTRCTEPNNSKKTTEEIKEVCYALKVNEKLINDLDRDIREFYEQIKVCCKSTGDYLYKRICFQGTDIDLVYRK